MGRICRRNRHDHRGGVAERLAGGWGRFRVRFLPVEEVGYSPEHLDFAGTRSLGYGRRSSAGSASGNRRMTSGIRKFVMLNAHGGNSPLMTIVATELRCAYGMLAVATSWTRFGYPETWSDEERAIGIHGGFIETSVMLALRPDLVDMDKARDFPSAQSRFARDFTHLRAYGPARLRLEDGRPVADGVVGNAAAATPRPASGYWSTRSRGWRN
jgi:creatinine amidohydrolase